jgi:hypothetical protein
MMRHPSNNPEYRRFNPSFGAKILEADLEIVMGHATMKHLSNNPDG